MRGDLWYALFMIAACFIATALALGLVLIAAMGWPDQDWPFVLGPIAMILVCVWFDRIGRSLFGGES